MKVDIAYNQLINQVQTQGRVRGDRTGTGTTSIFSSQIVIPCVEDEFPLITGKKIAWDSVVGELLWFINGETTIPDLKYRTYGDYYSDRWTIWTPNYEKQGALLGYDRGYCGPIYGSQWRDYNEDDIDQLQDTINMIKTDPESRRLLVTAWNPSAKDAMILPPCHWAFEFYVDGEYLNCKWHQRSVDVFLGLPFNIVSYALLLKIVAKITGYKAGTLIGDLTNVHIYNDHREQVEELLSRQPMSCNPVVEMPDIKSLDDLSWSTADDFKLTGYESHPTIKAKMSA